MIAAHYIGLLLLSTAAEGSREHRAIIEANDPGIWYALIELELVNRTGDLYVLSERGKVLVAHILALPLPQRVNSYSMAGVTVGAAHALHSGPAAHAARYFEQTLRAPEPEKFTAVDDENYVHTVAPVSMLPKIDIPADPGERRALASRLLDNGYSMGEVGTMLDLDESTMQGIFNGGSR